MVAISDICKDFWSKEPNGVSLPFTETLDHKMRRNLKTVVQDNTVYLVGYDWAVYAIRSLKENHSVWFPSWEEWSATTNKHLSKCELNSKCDAVIRNSKPTIDKEGKISW